MTPRALVTGLATAALVATAGLAAALPASAAPTAPYTALSIRFPVVGERTGAFTYDSTDGGAVTAVPTGAGGVAVTATRGGSLNELTITPRTGEPLAAGQSFQLAATPTVTQGSVELSTNAADCTYASGVVSIHELTGDATTTSVLAADVTGTCGTIQARVSAQTPWTGLAVPAYLQMGEADLATYVEQDLAVKVTGTSSVTFGSATIPDPVAPEDFPEFEVVDDGCKGTLVVPDGTCTVTIGFSPMAAGERRAVLTVPDTTSTGSTRVELLGTGTTDAAGTYVGTPSPRRLLDTRTAGTGKPLAGGSTTRLKVTGTAGVAASGVSAVVLNLTAVETTHEGYFTLYPNGLSRPRASSINFPKGWTGATMVTVPVGTDGRVAIYNYGGAAHAVVDVLGWYWKDSEKPVGSQLFAFGDSERVFDSRDEGGPIGGGDHIDIAGLFGGPTETADISQFVVNVTAVGATRPGVLTVWSGVGTRPRASSVNYEPKVIAPNMVIVKAGQGGDGAGFRISNTSSGSVDVVVDLVGIHVTDSPFGLRFTPRPSPTRLLDTRTGTGLSGPFGSGQTRTVNGSPVSSIDTFGLVAATTGIKPTRQTYLSTWSGEPGSTRTEASLLNVAPGVLRSASTYALMTENHRFKLYNNAGSMHVVMDVAGTLDFYPRSQFLGPRAATARAESTDAGDVASAGVLGGRDLRPTATLEHVTSRVTRH